MEQIKVPWLRNEFLSKYFLNSNFSQLHSSATAVSSVHNCESCEIAHRVQQIYCRVCCKILKRLNKIDVDKWDFAGCEL